MVSGAARAAAVAGSAPDQDLKIVESRAARRDACGDASGAATAASAAASQIFRRSKCGALATQDSRTGLCAAEQCQRRRSARSIRTSTVAGLSADRRPARQAFQHRRHHRLGQILRRRDDPARGHRAQPERAMCMLLDPHNEYPGAFGAGGGAEPRRRAAPALLAVQLRGVGRDRARCRARPSRSRARSSADTVLAAKQTHFSERARRSRHGRHAGAVPHVGRITHLDAAMGALNRPESVGAVPDREGPLSSCRPTPATPSCSAQPEPARRMVGDPVATLPHPGQLASRSRSSTSPACPRKC